MGGEYGGRGAVRPPIVKNQTALRQVMLHAVSDLEGAVEVGDSGIFVGGIRAAAERVESGCNQPSDFKFFFNFVRWSAGELERDVDSGRWHAFRIPPELILHQDDSSQPSELWNFVYRRRLALQSSTDDDISIP